MTEDTKTIQKENEALIEQMMTDAGMVDEPGELAKNPIVHKGDEAIPSPMVGKISSAGYVKIYDTRTGEESIANRNMLRQLLRVKRDDNSQLFTTIKPPFAPKVGTNKCMLHPDSPNRAHYTEMGLPVCHSAHLSSEFQVERHMQKRHPAEWAAIKHEREQEEKKEERGLRHILLSNAVEKVEASKEKQVAETTDAPLYVSPNPAKPGKKRSKRG